MAPWPRGEVTVCNTGDAGSNPVGASILEVLDNRLLQFESDMPLHMGHRSLAPKTISEEMSHPISIYSLVFNFNSKEEKMIRNMLRKSFGESYEESSLPAKAFIEVIAFPMRNLLVVAAIAAAICLFFF